MTNVLITRFSLDNNSQATWLSGDYRNIKTFMDKNNETITWYGRERYANVVN
jgi:hypothetical protein